MFDSNVYYIDKAVICATLLEQGVVIFINRHALYRAEEGVMRQNHRSNRRRVNSVFASMLAQLLDLLAENDAFSGLVSLTLMCKDGDRLADFAKACLGEAVDSESNLFDIPDCPLEINPGHSEVLPEFATAVTRIGTLLSDKMFAALIQNQSKLKDFLFQCTIGAPAEVTISEAASEGSSQDAVANSKADLSSPLTARELQVMVMLARGMTSRDISSVCDTSLNTIETHRGHVMGKLGLRNNTELARFALQGRHVR